MSVELKIKAITLGYEATQIRRFERKFLKSARTGAQRVKDGDNTVDWVEGSYRSYRSLNDHRRNVVRPEARATHLARAYLKGQPYAAVEASTREPVQGWLTEKVARMASNYGPTPVDREMIEKWMAA